MKFRCEKDELVAALGVAGRAAAATGHGAWTGIHLAVSDNLLRVVGYDGELLLAAEVGVNSEVDGVSVVGARIIVDVVKSLDTGAVEIDADGDWFTVRGGRSEFRLPEMPAVSYAVPPETHGELITLSTEDLGEGLRQVVKAASKDDSRPVLMGVKMTTEDGSLRMVSTDTFRMAIRDFPGTKVLDEGEHVIVPSRALSELARLLATGAEATVVLSPDSAAFIVGAARLQTKLIALEFPAYEPLLAADQPNCLTVDRTVLMDAVRRMKLVAHADTPIRLSLHDEGVELRVETPDVGVATEDVDGRYLGEEMVIGFNPDYLLEGLDLLSTDEVELHMQGAQKPARLQAVGSADLRYILMPQKIPTSVMTSGAAS